MYPDPGGQTSDASTTPHFTRASGRCARGWGSVPTNATPEIVGSLDSPVPKDGRWCRVYKITGPFTRSYVVMMSTDFKHVYYSSASADNLNEAVLEAVRAGVALSGRNGEANLDGLSLPGADLRNARLSGCAMRGANLRGANLSGAELGNLEGADLSHANLSGARVWRLRGADLSGADLSDVRLFGEMHGARMSGANVRGVCIADWNLGRTDLTECLNLGDIEVEERASGSGADDFAWVAGLRERNERAIIRARGVRPAQPPRPSNRAAT